MSTWFRSVQMVIRMRMSLGTEMLRVCRIADAAAVDDAVGVWLLDQAAERRPASQVSVVGTLPGHCRTSSPNRVERSRLVIAARAILALYRFLYSMAGGGTLVHRDRAGGAAVAGVVV